MLSLQQSSKSNKSFSVITNDEKVQNEKFHLKAKLGLLKKNLVFSGANNQHLKTEISDYDSLSLCGCSVASIISRQAYSVKQVTKPSTCPQEDEDSVSKSSLGVEPFCNDDYPSPVRDKGTNDVIDERRKQEIWTTLIKQHQNVQINEKKPEEEDNYYNIDSDDTEKNCDHIKNQYRDNLNSDAIQNNFCPRSPKNSESTVYNPLRHSSNFHGEVNNALNKNKNNPFLDSKKNDLPKKIAYLFSNNDNSNVTHRREEDESVSKKRMQTKDASFKFINDIKKTTILIKQIPWKKILNWPNAVFFKIFLFTYENYENWQSLHPFMKAKLSQTLQEQFSYIIKEFTWKYSSILNIEHYDFFFKEKKIHFRTFPTFELVIQAKVKEWIPVWKDKNTDWSFILPYQYTTYTSTKMSTHIFQYDIRVFSKTFPIYLCSEFAEKNNKITRLVYTASTPNYTPNDTIKFQINWFESSHIIDQLRFMEFQLYTPPKKFFEKQLKKDFDMVYDNNRACEIENMVHVWKKWSIEQGKGKGKDIVNNIVKYFSQNFQIMSIEYDVAKYAFFRLKLKAQILGELKENYFLGVKGRLQIVSNESQIVNQCVQVGFINVWEEDKVIQIRKETVVFFYIIENKNKL